MGRTLPVVLTAVAVTAGFAFSTLRAAEDEKPKYTIKEVMDAHKPKNKLHEKVIKGTATDEEKAKLVEYYEALGKNKPAKGSAESWKKLTDELLAAAKDAKEGKEGASKRLEAAVKCGTCHSAHK